MHQNKIIDFKNDEMLIMALIDDNERSQEDAVKFIRTNWWKYTAKLRYKHLNELAETIGEEIFHDAIMVMIQNLKSGKFKKESKLYSYFFSILYKKIIDSENKRKDDLRKIKDFPQDDYYRQVTLTPDEKDRLTKLLLKESRALIGESCYKYFEQKYASEKPSRSKTVYKEIFLDLGLTSVKSVDNRRKNCRDKLAQFWKTEGNLMNKFRDNYYQIINS